MRCYTNNCKTCRLNMTEKKCRTCGEVKPIDKFYTRKDRGCYCYLDCTPCRNKKRHDGEDPIKAAIWKTISGHRHNGLRVEFTSNEFLAHIMNNFDNLKYCAICGKELAWKKEDRRKDKATTPSFDRIDNEDFLTLDNVQVVCYRCNTIKSDKPMAVFIEYCRNVVKRYDKSKEKK